MSNPDEDLLTTEGVDEGSALSASEGPDTSTGPTPAPSPAGPAQDESDPAPPSEVDTPDARRARHAGTGQQLEAGEG